ncbi:MAG: hypothetical protein M0R03_08735 [Novosphingobium sp.]|nr:hypothetical protein [Novosphingobium sp.]
MSRQIIIKDRDTNTIAVWSTIVDNFIFEGNIEDWTKRRIEEESIKIRSEIYEIYKELLLGEKPYYQFSMTYEEALKEIKNVHGE